MDTGINGECLEFPAAKRQGAWQPIGDTPWTDWDGHGTMAACIAAGTTSEGGAFDGVAPEAGLIACKTYFYDSELASAYDYLIDRTEREGLRIVVTNSFGQRTGEPPPIPTDSDFLPKPDVTAPTPENGVIVYGDGVLAFPEGWGTSGACPQAAGLAALLLSANGELGRERLFTLIRNTSVPLGHDPSCGGSGLIDCLAALRAAT